MSNLLNGRLLSARIDFLSRACWGFQRRKVPIAGEDKLSSARGRGFSLARSNTVHFEPFSRRQYLDSEILAKRAGKFLKPDSEPRA